MVKEKYLKSYYDGKFKDDPFRIDEKGRQGYSFEEGTKGLFSIIHFKDNEPNGICRWFYKDILVLLDEISKNETHGLFMCLNNGVLETYEFYL